MTDPTRAIDWGWTRLGPLEHWRQSMRTANDMMLRSGHAMCIAWGAEHSYLYNDAYVPILGSRHPQIVARTRPNLFHLCLAGALAIVIVWLTDPFEVVALSSRAFALFYALQCALALIVAIKDGRGSTAQRIGFVAIGLVCLVVVAVGAPAVG